MQKATTNEFKLKNAYENDLFLNVSFLSILIDRL